MRASYRIEDPNFSEFVFHCISTANQQQRTKVPFGFEKFLYPPSSTKAFAEKASLEARLILLSRLGIDWQLWLAPPPLDKKLIIETLEQYKDDDRLDSVNRMIGNNHFVFGSRDVMTVLGMMAQNCHSETYRINREYNKLAQTIIDGETKFNNVEGAKAAFEDYKVLLRFAMNVLMLQDFFDGGTVFLPEELMILHYLMLKKNAFVSVKELSAHFSHFKAKTIVHHCYKLWKSHHIDKFPAKGKYCISSTGVQALANFVARVVHQTMNV